jgi:hypothetical protein
MRSEDTDTEEPYFFHLIRQMGVLTDQQLSVMFGLGYSAVSRRAVIFKAKLKESRALQRKFDRLRSKIKT